MSELKRFIEAWEFEAPRTAAVMESVPARYQDFRPDPDGRSLGELAWHLAEIEALMTHGIETGRYAVDARPSSTEPPRSADGLAPGYRKVHEEALARVRRLVPEDMDRRVAFFGGRETPIGAILWRALLHHQLHHRGQLTLMLRLAGAVPPGLYGPTREEMAAMKARA